MFCPKCGENLPDGAQFCAKCGNRMQASAAPVTPPAQAASATRIPAAGAGAAIPGPAPAAVAMAKPADAAGVLRIATIAVMALALVFSLLPWFEPSSSIKAMTNAASSLLQNESVSQITGAVGASTPSLSAMSDSYAPFQFFALGGTIGDYARIAQQAMSAMGSLSSNIGGTSASNAIAITGMVSGIITFVGVLWFIGAILLVVGAIRLFKSSKIGLALAGSIILLIIAGICATFVAGALGELGSMTAFPALCLVASIAAIVLIVVTKARMPKVLAA